MSHKFTANDSRIALRVQHVSNGGLTSTNSGVDMLGLQFDLRRNQ